MSTPEKTVRPGYTVGWMVTITCPCGTKMEDAGGTWFACPGCGERVEMLGVDVRLRDPKGATVGSGEPAEVVRALMRCRVRTRQRAHDWMAWLDGHPDKWEAGRSEYEAITNLVRSRRELVGLTADTLDKSTAELFSHLWRAMDALGGALGHLDEDDRGAWVPGCDSLHELEGRFKAGTPNAGQEELRRAAKDARGLASRLEDVSRGSGQ